MSGYISNWQVQPSEHGPVWRERMTKKIQRQVIEEAYLAGFTIKQIASYFRISVWSMYEKISVKELKRNKGNLVN